MENNKPLLSICIPTYNREIYLKKLLDSIISQEIFINTNDVEIVIDDWPSKDDTEKLVKEYKEKYPNKIRYFRNDVAIWMCPAFLEAIEYSNWIYTWLMWSDDLMTKEALNETLSNIKKYSPWLILSDRYVFSDDSELINLNIDTWKENVILYNWQEFFDFLWNDNKTNWSNNWNFFTFISIFCFKQELYLKNKYLFLEKYNNYKRLNYNYFNFALIPMYNLDNEIVIIIKNKTLILAKWWNNWWSFNSMNIFNDLFFIIKIFIKSYNISLKCKLFFYHNLIYWFAPSIWWIIRKNKFAKVFYKPLEKIAMKILYK